MPTDGLAPKVQCLNESRFRIALLVQGQLALPGAREALTDRTPWEARQGRKRQETHRRPGAGAWRTSPALSVMRFGMLLPFEGWDLRYGNGESREGGSALSHVHWSKGTPGQIGRALCPQRGLLAPAGNPAGKRRVVMDPATPVFGLSVSQTGGGEAEAKGVGWKKDSPGTPAAWQ